jgi:hypothetical protein
MHVAPNNSKSRLVSSASLRGQHKQHIIISYLWFLLPHPIPRLWRGSFYEQFLMVSFKYFVFWQRDPRKESTACTSWPPWGHQHICGWTGPTSLDKSLDNTDKTHFLNYTSTLQKITMMTFTSMKYMPSVSSRISKGQGYQGFLRKRAGSSFGQKRAICVVQGKMWKIDRISLLLGSIKCFP